jgi:mediator of RNA polymerase II transcription subunit 31
MTATASARPSTTSPPKALSPRFTLELEFVLSLSNPYYLSHLALNYPQLLNPPKDPRPSSAPLKPESDASKFASYLSYLYNYWRKPDYARFLTHPGATLRNLELLQQEQFRRDIIRPDVIEKLLAAGSEASGGASGEGNEGQENKADEGDLHLGAKEGKVEDDLVTGGEKMNVRVG